MRQARRRVAGATSLAVQGAGEVAGSGDLGAHDRTVDRVGGEPAGQHERPQALWTSGCDREGDDGAEGVTDERVDLAGRLLARLEAELWEPALLWTDAEGDPQGSLASAVRGVVAVWERHGPVLRAIVEAALVDDHVHGLWRTELMERFIQAVTAGIERESRLGRTRPLPARETATALLLLNERYLVDRLGTLPQHDADDVAEVLTAIWTRTLYS